jgi:hypothetical protein
VLCAFAHIRVQVNKVADQSQDELDPLSFWTATRRSRYSQLVDEATLATLLCTPAHSISVERLFSRMGV